MHHFATTFANISRVLFRYVLLDYFPRVQDNPIDRFLDNLYRLSCPVRGHELSRYLRTRIRYRQV